MSWIALLLMWPLVAGVLGMLVGGCIRHAVGADAGTTQGVTGHRVGRRDDSRDHPEPSPQPDGDSATPVTTVPRPAPVEADRTAVGTAVS